MSINEGEMAKIISRKVPCQRTQKAGLQFSVKRVRWHMQKASNPIDITSNGSVFLTSVLEYLVTEVLESAGNMAKEKKRDGVTPEDIYLAYKNDEELNKLFTIATGKTKIGEGKGRINNGAPPEFLAGVFEKLTLM